MSLKETKHTKNWNSIPKQCKNCIKAIFTKENGEVLYQCSLFGSFKKSCMLTTPKRSLPKPQEITSNN